MIFYLALAEEREIVMRKLSFLPETNHLGSKHHTLFLDETEVYQRLHSDDSDLATRWSKKSLNQFAEMLDADPPDCTFSEGEKRFSKKVLLPGDLCRLCKTKRSRALEVSAKIRECIKGEWRYLYGSFS